MTDHLTLSPTMSMGDETTKVSTSPAADRTVDHCDSEPRPISRGQLPPRTGCAQNRSTDHSTDRPRGLRQTADTDQLEWLTEWIRVALYGRHSSDHQNPTSSGDQLSCCRDHCGQKPNWKIVGE